jgi:hypothetical protein
MQNPARVQFLFILECPVGGPGFGESGINVIQESGRIERAGKALVGCQFANHTEIGEGICDRRKVLGVRVRQVDGGGGPLVDVLRREGSIGLESQDGSAGHKFQLAVSGWECRDVSHEIDVARKGVCLESWGADAAEGLKH